MGVNDSASPSGLSPDDVRALPVVVDVVTAGRCWGLDQDTSYRLARSGQFPVPVLSLGRRLVCKRADLLAALGIENAL
jgi:hypothetical protein